MRPQPVHFIILLIVILLIFGAPKLPSIAKSIGKSLKVFKSEVDDLRGDSKDDEDEDDDRPAKPLNRTSSAPTVDDVTRGSETSSEPARDDERRRDQ
jgi:sec-independent protein translocase protein TatA